MKPARHNWTHIFNIWRLPGTTCGRELGRSRTRRILESFGTSTTTTGPLKFKPKKSFPVQKCDLILGSTSTTGLFSSNVWPNLYSGTFVSCSTCLPQALALLLQLLSWHSLTLTGFAPIYNYLHQAMVLQFKNTSCHKSSLSRGSWTPWGQQLTILRPIGTKAQLVFNL